MGLRHADLVERRRVIAVVDLAGFTRAVAGLDAMALARLVHAFYAQAAASVERHGGTVVKFVGDACLAVFDEERAPDVVDCVQALGDEVEALGREHGVGIGLGANVHLATVVEGEFGTGASASFDVISQGVIHVFRMGAGPGVRISEPVYRRLPNDRRTPWKKRQPPAVYTLATSDD